MNEARRRYGRHVWIITSLASREPVVFHALRSPRSSDDTIVGVSLRHARCGRELDDAGVRVHIDHARRFARACHQCWRVEQLELLAAA